MEDSTIGHNGESYNWEDTLILEGSCEDVGIEDECDWTISYDQWNPLDYVCLVRSWDAYNYEMTEWVYCDSNLYDRD